jgi:SPP1 family phage portal protein
MQPKQPYKYRVESTNAGGDEVIGEENYGALPIVPLYANEQHQSTLVGMRPNIDAYDLIKSGYANDEADCAQIYWLMENAGGMTDDDIQHFMDRLRLSHAAVADTDNSKVTPYTQEPPYQSREAFLTRIEYDIYRDFGAMNPKDVSAGNITATQIKAAYQAQDEEADDFEYRCIQFIRRVLALMGIQDMPVFKRNMVANQLEQVQMVVAEAPYLDDETILKKLPNITPDEVTQIMARKEVQDNSRWDDEGAVEQDNNGGYRYVE